MAESGRGRAGGTPAGEPRGLHSPLIVTAAKEVSAYRRCCVPGATSPGIVGEFVLAILAHGGDSARKRGREGDVC